VTEQSAARTPPRSPPATGVRAAVWAASGQHDLFAAVAALTWCRLIACTIIPLRPNGIRHAEVIDAFLELLDSPVEGTACNVVPSLRQRVVHRLDDEQVTALGQHDHVAAVAAVTWRSL
jgi:hypothetical protein